MPFRWVTTAMVVWTIIFSLVGLAACQGGKRRLNCDIEYEENIDNAASVSD